MAYDLEANKKNAIEFYRTAYGITSRSCSKYVGEEYTQHNPDVENGKEGLIDYFERIVREYPDKDIEFVRSVAEGDLVALHTHQTWPGNEEYITMDFLRFDDQGKIVEHWDSIQKIPKESKSGNPMY